MIAQLESEIPGLESKSLKNIIINIFKNIGKIYALSALKYIALPASVLSGLNDICC